METKMNEGMENLKIIEKLESEVAALKQQLYIERESLRKEICELRQDNRKLSQQVEDSIDRMRKAGLI